MTNPHTRTLREPDAARRFRDTVAMHQAALTRDEIIAKRFIALRLSDCGSDNTVYDSFDEAVRHQRSSVHPNLCFYFQIPLERINEYVCDTLLFYERTAREHGYRPDHGARLIIPTTLEML